jgi:hypothetical protein
VGGECERYTVGGAVELRLITIKSDCTTEGGNANSKAACSESRNDGAEKRG